MLNVLLMMLWLNGRVPTKNFTGFGPLFPFRSNLVAPFYKSHFLFGEKKQHRGRFTRKTEKKKTMPIKVTIN